MVHPRNLLRQGYLTEADQGDAYARGHKAGHELTRVGPYAGNGVGRDEYVHPFLFAACGGVPGAGRLFKYSSVKQAREEALRSESGNKANSCREAGFSRTQINIREEEEFGLPLFNDTCLKAFASRRLFSRVGLDLPSARAAV